MSNSQLNPLLAPFSAPFEAIPFADIKAEHFMPALDIGMERARKRIQAIRDAKGAADFANTMLPLETATEETDLVAEIFFNLLSAQSDDAMQALAKELSPKVAAFSNDVILDEKLFARVKEVYDRRASLGLNQEQLRLVEKAYRNFARNGAQLGGEAKQRLRAIDAELASLSPKFAENLLKATNAYAMVITDRAQLAGLPESAVEAAAMDAEKRGQAGSWVFTLEAPSFLPFLTYVQDRGLREKLWRAYQSRAFGGEFDNQETLKSIARLRFERAKLLGFHTHADYVLEERMAGTKTRVNEFLERLLKFAKPAAEREIQELRAFAREQDGLQELMGWDIAFYSEKLKEKKFHFNEEDLRPYFRLEKVIDGMFGHATRLFGLAFRERTDVPVYHPEVKVYEVTDSRHDNAFVGLFYTDYFPRASKRGGAWMTPFREQGLFNQKVRRPHVSIVCNFTKPTPTKPSLITFGELRTLYHEFGHALHGLLSDCTYRSLAGTNVYWDFVELPSQLMENWVLEKEVLDSFAVHYSTGEKMPVELMKKVKDSSAFHAGLATIRQLTFASLDMAWHGGDPSKVTDVSAFEREVTDRTRVLPRVEGVNTSTAFGHIFAGGYSAGYYSYKWAEVLEADAFELFKEKGLYDVTAADRLRREILSRGGTEHPMDLYKRFRGREPDADALMRRDRLI